ncbi:glycerate kinase [Robiginitalea sediminis]|uniref:glycerate kinase n=1 Tax=Robiginitalea sediminis TaxID=1982593 RepID=UPI000B4BCE32|nr:glycerate kinase [Robiginitalea sediminis]
MYIVLIPDKFKGSLTAAQVRQAIAEGVCSRFPEARFSAFEASDGGDGFLDAVGAVRPLQRHTLQVQDPLGRPVTAAYGYDPERREAFVEMARASGLVLVEPGLRDALKTNTYGTGELLRDALNRGARTLYVGLGGSATSDGGTGIASALGYRFLDAQGKELRPAGGTLEHIHTLVPPENPVLPKDVTLFAVNDVSNPLWGPDGAAFVYGPQKGASPEAVETLDRGLRHLDHLAGGHLGAVPGAGAAGGTAFGLMAFLGAEFLPGTQYLFRITGFSEFLEGNRPDYIITGEGKIDGQSLQGKLLDGVLREAGPRKIPVLAVCGACEAESGALEQAGLTALLVSAHPGQSLAWNMENGYGQVRAAVADYFRGVATES